MIAGVEARIQQRDAAFAIARAFATKLAERYPDLIAVVFGSMARGDFHDGSDIDLLLVSAHFPDDYMLRQREIYAESPGGIDIFSYTPDELRSMLRKNHPTAYWAKKDGVAVRSPDAWTRL